MTESTLDEIIRMATHSAHMAALGGHHRTNAEMVHAAVDAALRAAVANGVLAVAANAHQRLADGFVVVPIPPTDLIGEDR